MRTVNANFWLSFRVRVPRKNEGGEQIDRRRAGGARQYFHPKEVQRVTRIAACIGGFVKSANALADTSRQAAERIHQSITIQRSKCDTNGFTSDRIDVATEGRTTKLVRFPQSSAASHERVENRQVAKIVLLVERRS